MSHAAVEERNTRWLGPLPGGWSGGRLFQVADAWTSNVDKHTIEGEPPVRLCNYTDVYKNDTITSDMEFMAATAAPEQIKRFRIAIGDTIITKDSETADDIGIPAFVEYESSDLICGYHLAIVRPRPGLVDPKFLFWALKSDPTMGQWYVQAAGVTRVGLRSTDLSKVTIPLPPLDEQRRIADFLDAETAQIDTLIAEQEHFIALLRERRAAGIDNHFVSRNTPTRLKHAIAYSLTGPFGTQLSADEYVMDGVPVINPTHIRRGVIVPDPGVSVLPEKAAALGRFRLAEGDIVLGRKGEVDKSAIIGSQESGFVCGSDSMALRPRHGETVPRYLWWFLQSPTAHRQLELWSVGSTVAGLNQTTIARVMLPLPNPEAQLEIVEDLDKRVAEVELLISEAERNIELSKERRSALITAAVTGQIDVSSVRAA